jgi:uncharacterized protein
MHTTATETTLKTRPLSVKLGTSVAVALFLIGGGLSLPAQAASFHCGKSASISEKLVCSDPQLSSLDDKLAAAYQRAKDVAPDKQSVEDARVQQWQWRQHNCHDKACVANWYERRISELNADYSQGKQAQSAAFEASLTEQHLVPSAQAAVRALKQGDTAGNRVN